MSSLPPLLEGTIASQPFGSSVAGRTGGSIAAPATGTLHGESPEASAVAELGNLISSLGSLAAQAQSLPLNPPSLPPLPQDSGYRPQATDYTQLGDDSN